MHLFYDLRNTILCQMMLMSIATWKHLHNTTKLEWNDKIPPEIINLATTYTFSWNFTPLCHIIKFPNTRKRNFFLWACWMPVTIFMHINYTWLVYYMILKKQEFNCYHLSQRRIMYMTEQFRITKLL